MDEFYLQSIASLVQISSHTSHIILILCDGTSGYHGTYTEQERDFFFFP